MAYFTQRPTKRIYLDEAKAYYIDVYARLTYADRYEFGRFAGTLTELANFAILRLIAGWNLDDENGSVLSVSEETVGNVDGSQIQPVIDFVDEIVAEFFASQNPEVKPDDPEKKTSLKPPSASSEPAPAAE